MEKDPEMKGEGNSYTTEFRQYDPRLGRWLSLDPLMGMFPWMSPYVAFNNNPVFFTDPLGLEGGPPEVTGNETEGQGSKDGKYVFLDGKWNTGTTDGAVVTPDKGPSVLEAGYMGEKSYENDLKQGDTKGLIGGWKVADNVPKGVILDNKEIGFESSLYSRTTNGRTEYAYVLRGTDEKVDWDHNLSQAFGTSEQYDLAIENSKKIIDEFGLGKVTIVGHSLGGGLATASALETGADAIVFNPAWVSDATINEMGLDRSNYLNIKSFVVAGEILDRSQASAKVVIGQLNKVVKLNRPPNTTVLGKNNGATYAGGLIVSASTGVDVSVSLHGMKTVIGALKKKGIK